MAKESGRSRHLFCIRFLSDFKSDAAPLIVRPEASSMSTIEETLTPEESVARRFTKYLNGPMGRVVLQSLDEGESFVLQTASHTLRVTKKKGRAIVTPVH